MVPEMIANCERQSTSGRVECNVHVIYHVQRVLSILRQPTIIFAIVTGHLKMPTHLAVPPITGSNSTTTLSNSTLVNIWNGDAGFSFAELDGMDPSEQVCAPLVLLAKSVLRK
jgi:hypothetical protein